MKPEEYINKSYQHAKLKQKLMYYKKGSKKYKEILSNILDIEYDLNNIKEFTFDGGIYGEKDR